MSFYQTSTPLRFSTQNQDNFTQQNIKFLLSGFNQPSSGTSLQSYTGATGITYSADSFVNGQYIVRSGAGSVTDLVPVAANIVAALNANQWIRQLGQDSDAKTVSAGFNFQVLINNTSSNAITLAGNTGSTVGTAITLTNAKVTVLKVIVTNATPGSEAVYISQLGN